MADIETKTIIIESKEVPSSRCPMTGRQLQPDDPDKIPCSTCNYAQPGPFSRKLRKSRGTTTVECSYVEAPSTEKVGEDSKLMRHCDNLSPLQYERTLADVKQQRSMGRDVFYCGMCGIKLEGTCSQEGNPLAPCKR